MQNIMEATLTKSSYNLIMPIDLSALLLSATHSLVDHWIRQPTWIRLVCTVAARTDFHFMLLLSIHLFVDKNNNSVP